MANLSSADISGAKGPTGHPGPVGVPGSLVMDTTAGKMLICDNNGDWRLADQPQLTAEELKARDDYESEKELRIAKHKEKMDALKTLFPRGYSPIPNFDIMVDIAREDQLNPLYEQVLKEFEDAQSALHRAANKLASAVKLTDSDTVAERTRITDADYFNAKMNINSVYGKSAASTRYTSGVGGIGVNMTGAAAVNTAAINNVLTGPMGPPGPCGATGMTGPKGDKGDPGEDGVIDENLLRKLIRMVKGESK